MAGADFVREFHRTFNLPIREELYIPDTLERGLRVRLQKEELKELADASVQGDIVEVADALADTLYIAHGTALCYGVPLDAVLAEVHRSNMSKLGRDGKPIYRDDGKVMKGPDYFPPDIKRVIGV